MQLSTKSECHNTENFKKFEWQSGSLIYGVRRRTRSARYYQIFGQEPEYPCSIFFLQFIVGGFKCIIYYGLIFLFLKWYIWPIVAPNLTKYSLVQTTINRSSSLIDRLKSSIR